MFYLTKRRNKLLFCIQEHYVLRYELFIKTKYKIFLDFSKFNQNLVLLKILTQKNE